MTPQKPKFTLAVLALLSILGSSTIGLAQPPGEQPSRPLSDAMSIQFEVFPSALVSEPAPGTFEEVLETTTNTGKFKLMFPLIISPPRTVVLGALEYRFLRFDHSNWIADNAPYVPEEFHSLGIELTLRRLLSDQWAMSAHIKPALASDFKNVESDHVNVTGGLIFAKRLSPTLQMGLGVGYLNDFGEPQILPLLQVNWIPPGKDYHFTATLPRQAALWYQYRPKVLLGVTAKMEGETYRIGDELALSDNILKLAMGTMGPSMDLTLGQGTTHLVIATGISMARQFELHDKDRNTLRELDLEYGYFLRAGITFKR